MNGPTAGGLTDRDVASHGLLWKCVQSWETDVFEKSKQGAHVFSIHLPHSHSHFPCSQHGCTGHFIQEQIFKELELLVPPFNVREIHLFQKCV